MKSIIIIFILIFGSNELKAQQYVQVPGTEKFAGIWQYTFGQDSIKLYCKVGYFGGDIKIKGAKFFYTYKQGTSTIWDNFSNRSNDFLSDFGGSHPFGPAKDSMVIIGRDKLKRKIDEGFILINAANNQLTFKREIGINGGGISHYAPGEGPLPGYTLPATITFNKVVLEEARGVRN